MIFEVGDLVDNLYFVVEGKVKFICFIIVDDFIFCDFLLWFMGFSDMFGELLLVDGGICFMMVIIVICCSLFKILGV